MSVTALKLTSASMRARRMSRRASPMFSSVMVPWPRRVLKERWSLSLRVSNMTNSSLSAGRRLDWGRGKERAGIEDEGDVDVMVEIALKLEANHQPVIAPLTVLAQKPGGIGAVVDVALAHVPGGGEGLEEVVGQTGEVDRSEVILRPGLDGNGVGNAVRGAIRSEEHTSEFQSLRHLV